MAPFPDYAALHPGYTLTIGECRSDLRSRMKIIAAGRPLLRAAVEICGIATPRQETGRQEKSAAAAGGGNQAAVMAEYELFEQVLHGRAQIVEHRAHSPAG